ncbi:MAG: ABC transporter permease [Marinifilaceae bacterium]|jgi:ABC-2 type transport system permease protein|nr:ABC transporter permease [Marinifilaceae bacterium]
MKFLNTLRRIFFAELKTIFTDGGAILLFFVANLVYPVVYSTAYTNEVLEELSVCVIDSDNTGLSRKITKYLDNTNELSVDYKVHDMADAKELFDNGKIHAVYNIPKDFEKDILSQKQATLGMYGDGAYFLYYKTAQKALVYAGGTLSAEVEIKRLMSKGMDFNSAKKSSNITNLKVFNEYNPSGGYGSFLMPAIIYLILQQTLLIGIGLLGGTQREKNTFKYYKAFDNKRGGIGALVIGKAMAYVLVYLVNFILSLYVINDLFGFPNAGSFTNQLALTIPYLFAVSFLGMSISTLFKTRVQSLLFLVFLSPVMLFMVGISWPLEAIPTFLKIIFSIFPSQFAIPAFIRIKLMDAELAMVSVEYIIILIQMVIYFGIACFAYKRMIHKN